MAPRILRVLVILLLAMAINVAVAWGSVWLYMQMRSSSGMQVQSRMPMVPSKDAQRYWQEEFGPSAFVTNTQTPDAATNLLEIADDHSNVYWLKENHLSGFGCSNLSLNDELRQAPIALEVLTAGWPMKSLRCERVFGLKKYEVKHAWMAFANNGTRAGGLLLPLKPMWIGAIVNTLMYAALLLTMWTGIARMRRAFRVRRKRCSSCGYDLRAATGDVCPECGTRQSNDSRRV